MLNNYFFKDAENHSLLISYDSKTLYQHNAVQVFPAASLIKLPIMLMIYDRYDHCLSQKITIKERVEGCGISPYLSCEIYTVHDLTTMMIACSDNTATNALIDWLGMDQINQYFKDIDLKFTTLNRRMMDIERRLSGYDNFTSAEDMMLILNKITEHRYFEEMFLIMKRQQLKEKVLLYISEQIEIGTKSGEFDEVRHEVGIARYKNSILLFVVLSEHQDAVMIHQSFHQLGIDIKNFMHNPERGLPPHNVPYSNQTLS